MALPAEFMFAVRDSLTGKVAIYKTPNTLLVDSDTLTRDGISTTPRRPCLVKYRGDVYMAGCFSRPVYYPYRDPRWVPVAITPPTPTITVVAGSGSGGPTGTALCFIAYSHWIGDVMLAESNPSNVVTMTLTGTGRLWGNLYSGFYPPERRVTHVCGYASVNGSNYRRAFKVPIGTASYEENLDTNQLTIEGPEGNYLPPNGCAFMTEFAGRMIYANTSEHPYRLWISDAGQPQYVGVASVRDTLDRDPIVGMLKLQNILLVGTATCMYGMRDTGGGLGPLEKLDSHIGLLSHFGMMELHNKVWFPSHDGVFAFDGAGFYFMMKDIRPYWLADRKEHQTEFDNCFAVDDRIGKNYLLITNRPGREDFEGFNPGTVIYVGNYLNFERTMGGGQEQPDWSLDCRTRFDEAAFYGLDNVLYFGSEDGEIRAEDATDGDDDGDTMAKPMLIEMGCMLFGEPGDDPQQGKRIDQLWTYVQSETTTWTLYIMMGDEYAGSRVEPDNVLSHWKVDVPASALEQAIGDPEGGTALADYCPETVHYHGSVEGSAGRGLTLRIRATSPIGFAFRGYGGVWAPGQAPRLEAHITRMLLSEPSLGTVAPNTATTRYTPAGGAPYTFTVTFTNADMLTYPFNLVWTWAGAYVATHTDAVASGLTASSAFSPNAGDSTLTISVTIGAMTMTKTYYFRV